MNINTDEIKSSIVSFLGIDLKTIHGNLDYLSVTEWSSLQHIRLMAFLSEKYKVEINSKSIPLLTDLDKITSFIKYSKGIKLKQETKSNPITNDKIQRGLVDICYDKSSITCIDSQNGKLKYRGFDIEDLANYAAFEEVVFIVLYARQPLPNELEAFKRNLFNQVYITEEIIRFISDHAKLTPTKLLQVIIICRTELWPIIDSCDSLDIGLSIFMNMISCLGIQRMALSGNKNILSEFCIDKYSSLAEFCYAMLISNEFEDLDIRIFEKDMILHMDHESNASTFVARIAKSTISSIDNAIIAAIATFEGEVHGGALLKVTEMLEEIKSTEDVPDYIVNRLKHQLPIYGWGHRVYKTIDPRAKIMKKMAADICNRNNDMYLYNIVEAIESAMQNHVQYGLAPNVDFYVPIIYKQLKMDKNQFVPLFIISRCIGWIAHILEQESNNILIRPRLKYIGNTEKSYV